MTVSCATLEMERFLRERDERELQSLVAREIRELDVRGPFLDIGSGTGLWVAMVREAGEAAFGIDPSLSLASVARDRYRLETLVVGDGLQLPFRDGFFRFVHLGEVIEHVDRAAGTTLLKSIQRVLARGGRVRITTPNRLKYLAPSRRPLGHLAGLLGRASDRAHRHEYWPWELRRQVKGAGFEVLSARFRVPHRYLPLRFVAAGLEIIAVKL